MIRPYQNTDKRNLLDILRLNTPTYFAEEETDDFILYLEKYIELYYVIEIENQVVGCGGINFDKENKLAKISWDIIHPNYQGQGLGAALLQYRIEKISHFPEIEKIWVRTAQTAYQFYEKQGFKLLKIEKDYWAKGFDLYLMEYVA